MSARLRKTIMTFAAGIVLLGGVLIGGAGGASAESAEFKADSVSEIHASQADQVYIPLFASRKEDQAAIAKVVGILNSMAAKGKVSDAPEMADPELSFFRTSMDVSFADGSSLTLFISDPDTLAYDRKGKRTEWTDKAAVQTFQSLLVAPEPTRFDRSSVRVGGELRLRGSDAGTEAGKVYVFQETSGAGSTIHSAALNVDFPSKTAVLLYAGESKYGRYDFTFTLPAAGKGWDGKSKPVSVGKSYLTVSTGWTMSMPQMNVEPAGKLLLAVNGIPVTDAAAQPIVSNDRTLVPLRSVAKLVGRKVEWDAKGRNVLIRTSPSQANASPAGHIGIWIDGKAATSDVEPIVKNGTTYVPVRTVVGAFGVTAEWLTASQVVNLIVD